MSSLPAHTELIVPFFKHLVFPLGAVGFIVLTYLVIVGSSNAVNLTDGLDGLAIMPTVMVSSALAIFAYVAGHLYFSKYLGIPYVPGAGELAVFCAAMAGAGLGFLWFNAYPAEVFMGDVGALALGAALGVVAVIVRQEIVLFIMGGVFVVETLSVVVQVSYFKYTKYKTGTGQRIFLMAPLHHHYEQKGWKETQVVVRFWIITMMLVLVGLIDVETEMKLELKDKQVLVLGLGDTGLSALRWLQAHGARLSVADTREAPPGLATVAGRNSRSRSASWRRSGSEAVRTGGDHRGQPRRAAGRTGKCRPPSRAASRWLAMSSYSRNTSRHIPR